MSKSWASLLLSPGKRRATRNLLCQSSEWCFSRHAIIIFSQFSTKDEEHKPNSSNNASTNSHKDDSKDSRSSLINDAEDKPFFTQDPAFGNKDNKGLGAGSRPYFNPEDTAENVIVDYELQPPTNCCMSGCPNCVWLEYVEKLTTIYSNPDLTKEKILKELNALEDQNIKAFIMMELRTRKLL